MQRGYERGYGRAGRVGRAMDEPSYQTYPSRGMAVEKYRPAYDNSRRYGTRSEGPGGMYSSREPVYPRPMAPEPGYGYQRPVKPTKFFFWTFRLLGLAHIALAVLLFVLGMTLLVLASKERENVEDRTITQFFTTNAYFYGFDGACCFVIAPLVAAIGILGWFHTPSRGNLEAVRNSYLVLSVVSALLCGSITIFESILHFAVYLNNTPSEGFAYTQYVLLLCLLVFLGLETVVATVSSCFACCTPGCCVPIVNEYKANAYVYTENEPLDPLISPSHSDYYQRDPYAFDNRRY